MPELSTLPLFITAALVLLLTPGPAVMYIVARSVDQGRTAGLVSVLGLTLGTFFHVIAAALGLSAILVSSALAFDVVKYLGAAYLIYMGVQKLRSKTELTDTEVQKASLRDIFRQGVVVNILNPKTALFFFSFMPLYIDSSRGDAPSQLLFLGTLFVCMALITDGSYALLAGTAGGWLKQNRAFLRAQHVFAGVVYIGLGIITALSSGNRKV